MLYEWNALCGVSNATPPAFNTRNTRHVVQCTPEIAFSPRMLRYIQSQQQHTRKQWVYEILDKKREVECVLYEDEHIVLLPDTEVKDASCQVNLLAIFKDKSLHTIRNLEGKHVPMLRSVLSKCLAHIVETTGVGLSNVMAYFHYLPSVFQLHAHFCAPYGQYTTLDVCKVHTIENVISNLLIDPSYYQKVTLTTVVVGSIELQRIYGQRGLNLGPAGRWGQTGTSSMEEILDTWGGQTQYSRGSLSLACPSGPESPALLFPPSAPIQWEKVVLVSQGGGEEALGREGAECPSGAQCMPGHDLQGSQIETPSGVCNVYLEMDPCYRFAWVGASARSLGEEETDMELDLVPVECLQAFHDSSLDSQSLALDAVMLPKEAFHLPDVSPGNHQWPSYSFCPLQELIQK